MKTKSFTIYFLLLFILFILPTITHAQPGFGDDVDDVPIDGGLSLLLVAGAGYASKKIRDKKKK